jgi:hypothetical protein
MDFRVYEEIGLCAVNVNAIANIKLAADLPTKLGVVYKEYLSCLYPQFRPGYYPTANGCIYQINNYKVQVGLDEESCNEIFRNHGGIKYETHYKNTISKFFVFNNPEDVIAANESIIILAKLLHNGLYLAVDVKEVEDE